MLPEEARQQQEQQPVEHRQEPGKGGARKRPKVGVQTESSFTQAGLGTQFLIIVI